jgi:hypothetical protein
MERKMMGKPHIQEKISFVKMEYFLYVFVEAQRLIKELEKLEYSIPLTYDLIKKCNKEKQDMAT